MVGVLICGFTYSQNKTIKRVKIQGLVTDSVGYPIRNAVLYVDSVKTFAKSNKKGIYKTKVYSNTDMLSMFSKDYGITSKKYVGEEVVDFQFDPSSIFYSERDLEALGYTVVAPRKGTIDPSKFKEYSNIYQLIREMFTGVQVRGSTIVVRGQGSFGDATPLFLVDDNYVNDISFVNPVEVRSIELLKGEDATLYGSRGANGVFLIYLNK
jgi:hypothetical protein